MTYVDDSGPIANKKNFHHDHVYGRVNASQLVLDLNLFQLPIQNLLLKSKHK